ncbi:MAG: acyl--CoA ligase [Betaproteobacteria bacterium]|nr:acyl--CoA ligase [Betaproteobacteria bacterium]
MRETIVAALARHARERPAAGAIADDRSRLSWGETEQWVGRAAGWLAAHKLRRGAAVLGWLPNCAELYLLRLACEQAGFFWVPVPASLGRREIASITERVRPAVAVSFARFRERAPSEELDGVFAALGMDPIRVTVRDEPLLRLDGPPPRACDALRLEEDAHALATTGSEGIPKLAVFTLAAACERAHAQTRLLGLTAADILLTLSPGVGPARAAWLAAPLAGAGVVALLAFGADAALEWIERERPSVVCGTPSQLAMLAPGLARIDCTTVRLWYTAGSVLPVSLAEALEATTHGKVVSTYGGADFGGWAAADPDDPPAIRHRTVGRGRGGTEFRIVDSRGRDLPAGAPGELIGRGPCCVRGYLGEVERDRWRDGWFHTGDLASADQAGNIAIVGRLKEVIIRGGDNVSPAEIEALLRADPEVSDAAVIGVSDPVLGERVCACVVPVAGAAPGLESLRDRLRRSGLAHFKLPERLVVLDALPWVGDKINRRALAELAAARLAQTG